MRPQIRRLLESAGFSPRQLFAALQGAWLEPTPGYIWQENTGVTPTTTGGQTIGLLLDQSQGAVLGPELVTNGTFNSDTSGWFFDSCSGSASSGQLVLTASANFPIAYQTITVVPGQTYYVTCDFVSKSGPNIWLSVGTVKGNGSLLSIGLGGSPQTVVGYFTPTTSSVVFSLAGSSSWASGNTLVVDNISVRQVLGNHAAQSTAANRPLLGRRYNLLTYSEDFSNAVWSVTGITRTYNSAQSPSDSGNAVLLTESNADERHLFGSVSRIVVPANTNATLSRYIKKKERRYCQLGLLNGAIDSASIIVDLDTGQVTSTRQAGNTTYVTSSCTAPDANGWCLATITAKTTASDGFYANVALSNTSTFSGATIAFGTIQYAGDGTSGIYIWGADLRLTSDVGKDPAYQRITTATDYDVGQYPAAVHDSTDSLVVNLPSINVRRNLLTNSLWAGALSGTPGTAPTGYTFAFNTGSLSSIGYGADGSAQLTISASSQRWIITQSLAVAQNTSYTHSLTVISNPNSVIISQLLGHTNAPAGSTVTISANNVAVTSAYVPVAGDRIANTLTIASTTGTVSFRYGLGAANNTTGVVTLTQPQLELGSTATDYQKITDWTSEAYASSGSVYFATPVGMSALHNQSMATSYTLPALSTDIYSWIVVPQRLNAAQESRLARYMERKAGIAGPDTFEQVDYAENSATTTSITGAPIGGPAFTNYALGANRVAGRTYLIAFDVSGYAGTGDVGIAGGSGSAWVNNTAVASANGSYSALVTSLQTSTISMYTRSTNTCNFSNISVRELKDGMTGQLLDDNYEPLLMG